MPSACRHSPPGASIIASHVDTIKRHPLTYINGTAIKFAKRLSFLDRALRVGRLRARSVCAIIHTHFFCIGGLVDDRCCCTRKLCGYCELCFSVCVFSRHSANPFNATAARTLIVTESSKDFTNVVVVSHPFFTALYRRLVVVVSKSRVDYFRSELPQQLPDRIHI